ncbi:MAG: c-type cytochrome [Verrucomicrobiaceae bacterium]|nr:c-type cytochrome [Verrucomicrobiaceae bacterium]
MRPALLLLAAALTTAISHAQTGTIPKDRPRARPPSQLTGWADWEKGEALLKRILVPPAPIRSPDEEAKTFKLAPGYRIELVASEPMVQCPIFFEFDPDGRIWCLEYQGYMRDLKGSGEGDPICRLVVLEDTDFDGKADKQTVYLDKLVMPRSFAFVKGGILLQEPPKLWFCEDTNGDLKCDRRREVGTMGVAGNPQHTANGLRYGIDNWLHCADWPKKYRWDGEKLIEADTIHRGQFGVSFDDEGRFITCYENSALHMDLIPADCIMRNPNLVKLYQRSGSRGGMGLNVNIAKEAQEVFPIRVTPAVTLGALELRDDGRLRTYTIVSGTCFYNGDQFPDDAYGNVFVPESGGHLIGRLKLTDGIEPKAARFYPPEQEFLASTDERFRPVNARVGPDGCLYIADMYHGIIEHIIFMVPWLTKQIEERKLDTGNDLGRIWRIVCEGKPLNRKPPTLGKATSGELRKRLEDINGWSRLTAQRLLFEQGETVAPKPDTADEQAARLHALVKLGDSRTDESLAARLKILQRDCGQLFRIAALSGLHGMELKFLALPWGDATDEKRELFSLVAQSIAISGDTAAIKNLREFASHTAAWQKDALLKGINSITPELQSPSIVSKRTTPLAPDQQKQFDLGKQHFAAVCAACHQPHGGGVPGAFPPLVGSEWVMGDPARLIRIVLQGVYGPIEVKGQPWNLAMPGQGMNPLLDEAKIAAVLSYVRNEWGNEASFIGAKMVSEIRGQTTGRMLPWTVAELNGITASPLKDAAIVASADGSFVLPASRARIYGQKLAYRPSLDVLAPWTVADDSAEWIIEAKQAGEYAVFVELAADDDSAGDRYTIQTEGSQTTGTVQSTGGYENPTPQKAGTLKLKAGINHILMRPEGPLKRELADVRSVVLKSGGMHRPAP